jgi:hypothetical protein
LPEGKVTVTSPHLLRPYPGREAATQTAGWTLFVRTGEDCAYLSVWPMGPPSREKGTEVPRLSGTAGSSTSPDWMCVEVDDLRVGRISGPGPSRKNKGAWLALGDKPLVKPRTGPRAIEGMRVLGASSARSRRSFKEVRRRVGSPQYQQAGRRMRIRTKPHERLLGDAFRACQYPSSPDLREKKTG